MTEGCVDSFRFWLLEAADLDSDNVWGVLDCGFVKSAFCWYFFGMYQASYIGVVGRDEKMEGKHNGRRRGNMGEGKLKRPSMSEVISSHILTSTLRPLIKISRCFNG